MLLEQGHVNECLDVLCSVCNMTSEHDVTAQVHALVGDCFSRQVGTIASNIRSLKWVAIKSFHDIFYYHPQKKSREGNVFTGVCHSFRGGSYSIM